MLLLFSIILESGCSKDNEAIDPNADELGVGIHGNNYISTYGDYDENGIFCWYKEEASFIDYYFHIDTLISDKTVEKAIRYFSDGTESVSVNWTTNGKIISKNETKTWDEDEKKWIISDVVTIDIDGMNESYTVEAIVQYRNKSSRRFQTVPIKIEKNVSDAFDFTSGTNIDDMRMYIENVTAPTVAKAIYSDKYPVEYFEFSEMPNRVLNKLYIINRADYQRFLNDCKKCNIPETPKRIDSSYNTIVNPQEWESKSLKFKLYNTTYSDLTGSKVLIDYDFACLKINGELI